MDYLFVYGSLKQGFGLSSCLDSGLFIGRAKTNSYYTLISGHSFPFLVKRDGLGAFGEVYLIYPEIIPMLDRIEGHPDFYKREKILTKLDDGAIIETWAYIHPDVFKDTAYDKVIVEWR